MSLRYADFRHCEACGRGTPHNKRGVCAVCRAGRKRAVRKAKASTQGGCLARWSDLRGIADSLWSVWVRAAAPGCRMCGVPYDPDQLQNAHGYTREDRVIRFDPDNTFALCAADHRRHTPPRPAWYAWMCEQLGAERFNRLERLSMIGGKFGVGDLHAVILDAQQRIAALPSGPRKEWADERARVILERMVRLGVRAA